MLIITRKKHTFNDDLQSILIFNDQEIVGEIKVRAGQGNNILVGIDFPSQYKFVRKELYKRSLQSDEMNQRGHESKAKAYP